MMTNRVVRIMMNNHDIVIYMPENKKELSCDVSSKEISDAKSRIFFLMHRKATEAYDTITYSLADILKEYGEKWKLDWKGVVRCLGIEEEWEQRNAAMNALLKLIFSLKASLPCLHVPSISEPPFS